MTRNSRSWDVFISHASEDKKDFVLPLSSLLRRLGLKVWLDKFEMSVGDSLSRSIDEGLSASSFGIVVLSPAFLGKDWPEYELRGLISKELGRDKVILPLWHEVTRSEVLSYSPPLADRLAILTENRDLVDIAIELLDVVRPDLAQAIARKVAFQSHRMTTVPTMVELESIKISGPRHESLPEQLLWRVRVVRAALMEVYPHSMEFWVGGFLADAHPTSEVEHWERLTALYLEMTWGKDTSEEERQEIFNGLTGIILAMGDELIGKANLSARARKAVDEALAGPRAGIVEDIWPGEAVTKEAPDQEAFSGDESKIDSALIEDIAARSSNVPIN